MKPKSAIFALFVAAFMCAPLYSHAAIDIDAFTATDTEIAAGETVSLIWNAPGATNCQLRDDTEGSGTLINSTLPYNGAYAVRPFVTTTYLIYCADQRTDSKSFSFDSKTLQVVVAADGNTGSIDKKSFKSSRDNTFKMSGRAPNASFVHVALVPSYYEGPSDWHTIYTRNTYIAHSGAEVTRVKKGKWSTTFSGIAQGVYRVMLYESIPGKDSKFLSSRIVRVSTPDPIRFSSKSKKDVVIGTGQTITDRGVEIRLDSVRLSEGTTGTPTATFTVESDGYDARTYVATPQTKLFDGASVSDRKSKTGSIEVFVEDIAVSMKNATLRITPGAKKG